VEVSTEISEVERENIYWTNIEVESKKCEGEKTAKPEKAETPIKSPFSCYSPTFPKISFLFNSHKQIITQTNHYHHHNNNNNDNDHRNVHVIKSRVLEEEEEEEERQQKRSKNEACNASCIFWSKSD